MKKPASAIFAAAAAVALVGCASSGGYQGKSQPNGQEEGLFGKITETFREAQGWIFGRSSPQYRSIGPRTWLVGDVLVKLTDTTCTISSDNLGSAMQHHGGTVTIRPATTLATNIIVTEKGVTVKTGVSSATLPRDSSTQELYKSIMRQYAQTIDICAMTRDLEQRDRLTHGTRDVGLFSLSPK